MRFNYNLLNNRIAQVCGSQQEFARRLGISFEELQEKLKCNMFFTSDEINKGIEILSKKKKKAEQFYFLST